MAGGEPVEQSVALIVVRCRRSGPGHVESRQLEGLRIAQEGRQILVCTIFAVTQGEE